MSSLRQIQSIEVAHTIVGTNRREREDKNMSGWIVKGALAAAAFLVIFTLIPAASKAVAGEGMRFQAFLADNGLGNIDTTCDPITFLPKPGDAGCVGIDTTTGTATGDINATYLAEVSWAVLESGDSFYTAYTTYNGSVVGHGSGSFMVLESDGFISSTGQLTQKWRVVNGSGTGNLAGMTGSGKVVGTYDFNTGLASGNLTGFLHFGK